MQPSPEYVQGWTDAVDLIIKQFSGIRENFLEPKDRWHQEGLQFYNSVIHLVSEYKDIQMKLAEKEEN